MTSLLLLCGYKQYYNFKILFRMLTPFYDIGKYFTSSIVPFFLLIPYLNIVIHSIDKKTHWKLIGGCLFIFTVLPSIVAPPVFLPINMRFGDICWFTVIYLIAAYIRLYPEPWFENRKLWFCALLASVILAWSSIAGLAVIISSPQRVGAFWHLYFFVADSNKILAVTTSICAFMFFKNLRIGQSKFINTVSASAFGVLLIHAASGVHRLIWDFLNCTGFFYTELHILILHAFYSVTGVYIICTLIDILQIRFFERPFFAFYDRLIANKKAKI